MNLDEATDKFLSHCESVRKLSHHTVRAYRLDLNRFASFAGTDQPVHTLEKTHVQDYVKFLFDVRGLGEASAHRHIATLRSFFGWATEQTNGAGNCVTDAKIRIRIPTRLPRLIPRGVIRTLLSESAVLLGRSHAEITASVAAELLFATGMRVSELATLKDENVDIDEGILRIMGKGSRERRVFVPEDLKDILRWYRGARCSSSPPADTFLVNSRGESASSQFIRRLIRELGEHVGATKRITPHMFRHSIATYLIEEGVDIRYVQRLLGHRNISTTEIYAHVADASLQMRINECHPRRSILQPNG
ncbi:MAG TPA: tyrosine-type recombinase/integrase [Thermoanaerobaculia bacterium]|nr:tyrosine-type recombinase/integrase [Thermoanaerobaculia bacterium]